MSEVTKPIALDESLNTTESTPRNIADVLASGLANIANNVKPDGSDISIDVPGMSAHNVNDGFSELKGTLDVLSQKGAVTLGTITPSNILTLASSEITYALNADKSRGYLYGIFALNCASNVSATSIEVATNLTVNTNISQAKEYTMGYYKSLTWNSSLSQINMYNPFKIKISTNGNVSFVFSFANNSNVNVRVFFEIPPILWDFKNLT